MLRYVAGLKAQTISKSICGNSSRIQDGLFMMNKYIESIGFGVFLTKNKMTVEY